MGIIVCPWCGNTKKTTGMCPHCGRFQNSNMPTYHATASAIRNDGDLSTVILEYPAPNLIDAWIVAERMADGWADCMGLREPQAMFVKIEEE